MKTRTWVRTVGGQALTTTYGYDNADDLTSVSYSDSTPSIATVYDRLGRQSTITFNGTTDTLTYNLANQLLGESYSGGILAGLAVTNGYDSDLRRTNVALNASALLTLTTYSYDPGSRLSTVTALDSGLSTLGSASYSYVANSPLVSQITFKQNGTTRMTTVKQYDYLNRLTSISSTGGASVPASRFSFDYSYNSANQRIRDTLADGSYWIYQYDSLGQVTSANKYWSDQTPVAGQQFDYAFDTIGNRTQTKTGGDQHGGNLRTANYYANTLNQYTSRDVPGYLDIKGVSFATNTVTVNGNTAYRKGEFFRDELSVNNSSSPVWEGITVAATGQPSVSGNEYVPQTPENFGYVADGNLTSDGRWTYVWDAENRLISLTANTGVGPQEQITFAYDAQGRRIEKVVSLWNGSAYVPQSTNIFLYDGWNLVAEVGPGDSLLRSYIWGTDLSGSQQGAGGVGGLLEISYGSTNCFVAYDGNGNVAALVNAADGTVAASYEYGPFGEVIRATGPMAKVNPFRFSTKYQDDESDLLYYAYRYYDPSTGRWLNRDPIHERGGLSLYALVANNPLAKCDYLGLDQFSTTATITWSPTTDYAGDQTATATATYDGNCNGFSPVISNVKWSSSTLEHGIELPVGIGSVNGGLFMKEKLLSTTTSPCLSGYNGSGLIETWEVSLYDHGGFSLGIDIGVVNVPIVSTPDALLGKVNVNLQVWCCACQNPKPRK